MRFSQLYCPTLKEASRDAEVISHQLMTRAGLIRKVSSGIYNYLPLGYKVLRKFQDIVRDEMNKAGANEVHMPMVIPAELWQRTERLDKYGKELLRFHDRHENEFCLGPTHEEVITTLASQDIRSYKQLPVCLYQIQTKFRDEIRPRFGLMRGREFCMKDAYSFDRDDASLDVIYNKMRIAYHAIFNRCDLAHKMVEADNGSIGGSSSAEFMVLADTGEDVVVSCNVCEYGANTEVHSTLADQSKCPKCGSTNLTQAKGIEVGHIFKLGDVYSQKLDATFTDEDGKNKPFVMGCYGIGVSRTIAAAIEQSHDEKGIVWPKALAPFEVVIILTNTKDEGLIQVAENLYETLKSKGIDVLLDDRSESAGVKFKDADLIGFPVQLVVGKRWQESQEIEFVVRKNGEKSALSIELAIQKIIS